VSFKIRQNQFPASRGSASDLAGGAHDAPQTSSWLERGHPSPYATSDPPSVLAMRGAPHKPYLRLWPSTINIGA